MKNDKKDIISIEELPEKMVKDCIIIVVYLDIRNMKFSCIPEYLESARKHFMFDESVVTMIIPNDGPSRVECINPVLLSEDEYRSVRETIIEMKRKMDDFLKNHNVSKN